MEEEILFWEALLVISTSQQGITCSELATEARE